MMKNAKNNTVILTGFVAQTPRVFQTKKGEDAVGLQISTQNRYYDREEKAYKGRQTVFHNDLVVFDEKVVDYAQKLEKGFRVCISGELQYRDIQDSEGHKRQVASIVVDHIEILMSASDKLKFLLEQKAAKENSGN